MRMVFKKLIAPLTVPNHFKDFRVATFALDVKAGNACGHVEDETSQRPNVNLLTVVASWILQNIFIG